MQLCKWLHSPFPCAYCIQSSMISLFFPSNSCTKTNSAKKVAMVSDKRNKLLSDFKWFLISFCINREKVPCYQLEIRKLFKLFFLESNFSYNQEEKCKQTLIAMHCEGYTSLEIQSWQGLFLPSCMPDHCSPAIQSSVLTKCSSEGVIWMCRASITSSSCLPWSSINVSSHWIGWLVVLSYSQLLHHPLFADILVVFSLISRLCMVWK